MRTIIYRIIYNIWFNRILRTLNKLFLPIIPKSIKIPPSGTITCNLLSGNKFYIKTNQTSFLTQIIFWNGCENFEYTNIFISLIKKVNTFYDVGANLGYYSLIASIENKNIKIVAFEPAKGPSFYLKENIKINNCNNICVESIALSDNDGYSEFYEIENDKYTFLDYNLSGEHNLGTKKNEKKNYTIHSVKTTTLDNYIKHVDHEIDLIKIDTEGTEHLILEKSSFILNKMKPIIICETLFNKIEKPLEEILVSFGYDFYNHTPLGLKKVNNIVRDRDNGVRNCFCVHPSKFPLIEEFII